MSKFLVLILLFICALPVQANEQDLFNLLDSLKIKTVSLSFDDGPNPTYTPKILSILKENNIKANFFLVGSMVEKYPYLVKQEVAEGHDLGGHSMTHKELTKIPLNDARREILESMDLVNKYQKTDLFRFPYGSTNKVLDRIVYDNGYRKIYWDVDTTDWKYTDKKVIYEKFKLRISKSKDHAVILMHDIHPQTVESLKLIVQYLKDNNIKTEKIHQ
jgi:peptidoglycan/xylan/chitin deacetylase (PgdA/CDA1 family)